MQKGAERFAKASTHWMRHPQASHAIAGGMPIEIAQNLGHASLATTTVYVTTEKRRRMKTVEAFWRRQVADPENSSSYPTPPGLRTVLPCHGRCPRGTTG